MKYFGTDGIRGLVGRDITAELCFKVGKAIGYYLVNKNSDKKNFVVIGKDPRISSYMIYNALAAGLFEMGVDILYLTVVPTPAVAYVTRFIGADMGIMITASHNNYKDNGIKLFSQKGFKLKDSILIEIEKLIDSSDVINNYQKSHLNMIGQEIINNQAKQTYLKYLIDNGSDLNEMRIALDCANGSTSEIASKLFTELNAKVFVMANDPNGTNINDGVGAAHPQKLSEFVKDVKADIGFSFDGDGDRLICVDDKGNIHDGDLVLFICAKYFKEQGILNKDSVVCTTISNMGLFKSLEGLGIKIIQTDVGDRYVSQAMLQGGFSLGSEKSGHTIFLESSTTGDGLLTALKLLKALKYFNITLSEAANMVTLFPSLSINIKVKDKNKIISDEKLKAKIARINTLEKDTRIILRASGTEDIVRLMVESNDEQKCYKLGKKLVDYIKNVLKNKDSISSDEDKFIKKTRQLTNS